MTTQSTYENLAKARNTRLNNKAIDHINNDIYRTYDANDKVTRLTINHMLKLDIIAYIQTAKVNAFEFNDRKYSRMGSNEQQKEYRDRYNKIKKQYRMHLKTDDTRFYDIPISVYNYLKENHEAVELPEINDFIIL